MKRLDPSTLVLSTLVFVLSFAHDARAQFNYDESKVPKFDLPDPLITLSGHKVTTADEWKSQRRAEVLYLFETYVYGRTPTGPFRIHAEEFESDTKALDGRAIRRQVTIRFSDKSDGPSMDVLIYLPASASKDKPAPVFLGLNFDGNHTVHKDSKVRISTQMHRGKKRTPGEDSRGRNASRWQLEKILAAGYGLATIYHGDIDPDFHDGYKNGVHPLFFRPGQTKPEPDEWTTIGAWAWGLSRAIDYFETAPAIDEKRVSVIGFSRLGKTALWAGAQDERIAFVISNNSGCGGAALSRRRFGETVKRINSSFPHWFCDNFKKYNDRENLCPVDQHMLMALIAPRPLYVASASKDRWADPKGEFESARLANPVYELLGTQGLPAKELPGVNTPIHGGIGYHLRDGKHDVTAYDWEQYIAFANKHLGRD